jgi:hypothetical protein
MSIVVGLAPLADTVVKCSCFDYFKIKSWVGVGG